jgi:hypothetical protein
MAEARSRQVVLHVSRAVPSSQPPIAGVFAPASEVAPLVGLCTTLDRPSVGSSKFTGDAQPNSGPFDLLPYPEKRARQCHRARGVAHSSYSSHRVTGDGTRRTLQPRRLNSKWSKPGRSFGRQFFCDDLQINLIVVSPCSVSSWVYLWILVYPIRKATEAPSVP